MPANLEITLFTRHLISVQTVVGALNANELQTHVTGVNSFPLVPWDDKKPEDFHEYESSISFDEIDHLIANDRWISIYLEGRYGELSLDGGISMVRNLDFANVWEIGLWVSSETIPFLNNPFDVMPQQLALYEQIAERIARYVEQLSLVVCGFQIEGSLKYKGSAAATVAANFCPCWIIPASENAETIVPKDYDIKTFDEAHVFLCHPYEAQLFRVYPGPVEEIHGNKGIERFRTL